MERIRVGIRRFLGFINQYSGQPLQEEDNSESAPTANPLSFSRPQILKIGMCAFHFAGFVTLMTGLKSGLQECKSLFPEIELPKNATQDFINKIDDKDYLRHNCEQKSIETVVYSAIGFHGCLSILDLMVRKFCLSSLGLGNQESRALLPTVGLEGTASPASREEALQSGSHHEEVVTISSSGIPPLEQLGNTQQYRRTGYILNSDTTVPSNIAVVVSSNPRNPTASHVVEGGSQQSPPTRAVYV